MRTDEQRWQAFIDGMNDVARAAEAAAEHMRVVLLPAFARVAEELHRQLIVLPAYERVWLQRASWGQRLRYHAMRLGGASQLQAILIIECESAERIERP